MKAQRKHGARWTKYGGGTVYYTEVKTVWFCNSCGSIFPKSFERHSVKYENVDLLVCELCDFTQLEVFKNKLKTI